MSKIPTDQLQYRTCPLCEGMCGVEVKVEGGKVRRIRPDRENVFSQGHICPKGTTLGEIHGSPDRLRRPLIREGGSWREVGWEEALRRVQALVHPVIKRDGRAAVAAYTGNMIAKSFDLVRYVGEFFHSKPLGGLYSSSTVDQQPKNLTCMLMYGDMWRIAIPDVDHTDLFVIMGANPSASKGSIFSHRDAMGAIKAVRERGGRVVVVDPVQTGTALAASQWQPIVPGTDAAYLFAIVHTLFAEGLVRLGDLEGRVNGVDALREAAEPFTPEAVAAFCDIPAESIRQLARDIAAARSAAVYGRIGLCTQRFGTLSSWLTDAVAILTGNFGRRGGMMFSNQVAPHLELTPPYPADAPIVLGHSRVRGAPAVLGLYPSSCLAEEIDTPGPGQTKGLITIAANPVLSAPGSERLDRALPLLDFMISFDTHLNETTRHAHVILPGASPLEQPHWDVWAWPWCLTSGGHYSPALFPRVEGSMDEWRALLSVAGILAGKTLEEIDTDALDDAFFSRMCAQRGLDADRILALSPVRGSERILDLAIRSGNFGDRYGERPGGLNLDAFKAAPHGLIVGSAEPGVPLRTPSGKIELAPEYLLADVPRLRAAMREAPVATVLVSRRTLRSMNSWMNNMPTLVKGRDRCTLLMHPRDAARIGVGNGDPVKVASGDNAVTAPAEITERIKPGVVSLPHGWGHDRPGTRLTVASRHPGVNSNRVNPANLIDTPSGNAVVNGVPVLLTKGERAPATDVA